MNTPSTLPPSPRDLEIHRLSLIEHLSTRQLAEKHRISQTRVRQIVYRVCEWLAAVLPVKTEAQMEQEKRLAIHLAAAQLQHQIEQLQTLWDATLNPKYLRQQDRSILALARLGVAPGVIDSLTADLTDNVVPSRREGREAEPSFNSASAPPDESFSSPPPDLVTSFPPDNAPPQAFSLAADHESSRHRGTHEVGRCAEPIPAAQNQSHASSIQNPQSQIPNSSPPPLGDCSPLPTSLPLAPSPTPPLSAPTPSPTTTSDDELPLHPDTLPGLNILEQRLLTLLNDTPPDNHDRHESLTRTLKQVRHQKATLELRISPHVLGAALQSGPSPNPQPQACSAASQT